MPIHLGSLCSLCLEKNLAPKVENTYLDREQDISSGKLTEYFVTPQDLQDSAEDGCPWCICIRKSFSDGKLNFLQYPDQNQIISLSLTAVGQKDTVSAWPESGHEKVSAVSSFHPKDAQFHQPLRGRPKPSSYVEAYVPWISERLRECSAVHVCCPRIEASQPPLRVLDVSPTHDEHEIHSSCVRLRSPQLRHAVHYTALSYCWGGTNNFKLTKSLHPQMMTRLIPIRLLPRTIREAVIVTRALNVKYLWVDTLCIVQDDKNDKRQQIAQMPSIFSNAYVTLVASQAKTVYDGFLHHARPFSIEIEDPAKRSDVMIMHVANMQGASEPIDLRAWTFEERILSRGLIIFTARGLFWECQDSIKAFDPFIEDFELLQLRSTRIVPIPRLSGEHPRSGLKAVTRLWHQLVTQYTRRSLTLLDDRWFAISGIAAELCKVRGPLLGKCQDGIWSSSAIEDLLWLAPDRQGSNTSRSASSAPTWSWVSVEGPVMFVEDTMDITRYYKTGRALSMQRLSINQQVSQPQRDTKNPSLISSITLHCLTVNARLAKSDMGYVPVPLTAQIFDGHLVNFGNAYFDQEPDLAFMFPTTTTVHVLLLLMIGKSTELSRERTRHLYQGIIVYPTPFWHQVDGNSAPLFRRVGWHKSSFVVQKDEEVPTVKQSITLI